ncbi:MAG: hypothetical protein AAGD01_10825 [Acidobacteriota bacterium]
MADLPRPALRFDGACPDCGERQITLPPPLPDPGDDFDWRLRDFDGFRLFLAQELTARVPERGALTPADLEVILTEALAVVLDQLSDQLDRVAGERFLETARRPESVRRLLSMIGFDAVEDALDSGRLRPTEEELALDSVARRRSQEKRLDRLWLTNPHAMEQARRDGPTTIHRNRRMVTADDVSRGLEEHPLVARAHTRDQWSGSWTTLQAVVVSWDERLLDAPAVGLEDPAAPWPAEHRELWSAVEHFHALHDLYLPPADPAPVVGSPPAPTLRTVLRHYLDAYRMLGQEVLLGDASFVPVLVDLSVRVRGTFYRSEVRRALQAALGTGPGGFFEPGRLRFGEDLHAGDVMQAATAVDGVESVCLNRFKRLGGRGTDGASSGSIVLEGLEVAECRSDPRAPHRGYVRIQLHGGLRG